MSRRESGEEVAWPVTMFDEQPLLITGISGFAGEHLARHFLARGCRVAGTFLQTPPGIEGVEPLVFDVTDAMAWRRLLRDMRPAAIVHCAAKTGVGWCEENEREAHAVNLEAVEHLCAAVRERAPETPVVYFSTDLVFDGEEAPYGEEDPAKPLSRYGSLKSHAEAPVRELLAGVVLRAALIYGIPASRNGSFLSWMVKTLAKGQELTLFRDEVRTPVFVEDLARAVEMLLDADPALIGGEVFHAGGPERLNRVQMGEIVCEVFDLPRRLLRPALRREAPAGHLRPHDVSLRSERLLTDGWSQLSFRDGLLKCRENWNSLKPQGTP